MGATLHTSLLQCGMLWRRVCNSTTVFSNQRCSKNSSAIHFRFLTRQISDTKIIFNLFSHDDNDKSMVRCLYLATLPLTTIGVHCNVSKASELLTGPARTCDDGVMFLTNIVYLIDSWSHSNTQYLI